MDDRTVGRAAGRPDERANGPTGDRRTGERTGGREEGRHDERERDRLVGGCVGRPTASGPVYIHQLHQRTSVGLDASQRLRTRILRAASDDGLPAGND